jgi:hypothetical protein
MGSSGRDDLVLTHGISSYGIGSLTASSASDDSLTSPT